MDLFGENIVDEQMSAQGEEQLESIRGVESKKS